MEGDFFRCTIEGICKDGNAPPVNGPTARGGLVLDVGVVDAVFFGVLLGVGVGEDAEGEGGAVVEGSITDFGDTVESADGFEGDAVIERKISNICYAFYFSNTC